MSLLNQFNLKQKETNQNVNSSDTNQNVNVNVPRTAYQIGMNPTNYEISEIESISEISELNASNESKLLLRMEKVHNDANSNHSLSASLVRDLYSDISHRPTSKNASRSSSVSSNLSEPIQLPSSNDGSSKVNQVPRLMEEEKSDDSSILHSNTMPILLSEHVNQERDEPPPLPPRSNRPSITIDTNENRPTIDTAKENEDRPSITIASQESINSTELKTLKDKISTELDKRDAQFQKLNQVMNKLEKFENLAKMQLKQVSQSTQNLARPLSLPPRVVADATSPTSMYKEFETYKLETEAKMDQLEYLLKEERTKTARFMVLKMENEELQEVIEHKDEQIKSLNESVVSLNDQLVALKKYIAKFENTVENQKCEIEELRSTANPQKNVTLEVGDLGYVRQVTKRVFDSKDELFSKKMGSKLFSVTELENEKDSEQVNVKIQEQAQKLEAFAVENSKLQQRVNELTNTVQEKTIALEEVKKEVSTSNEKYTALLSEKQKIERKESSEKKSLDELSEYIHNGFKFISTAKGLEPLALQQWNTDFVQFIESMPKDVSHFYVLGECFHKYLDLFQLSLQGSAAVTVTSQKALEAERRLSETEHLLLKQWEEFNVEKNDYVSRIEKQDAEIEALQGVKTLYEQQKQEWQGLETKLKTLEKESREANEMLKSATQDIIDLKSENSSVRGQLKKEREYNIPLRDQLERVTLENQQLNERLSEKGLESTGVIQNLQRQLLESSQSSRNLLDSLESNNEKLREEVKLVNLEVNKLQQQLDQAKQQQEETNESSQKRLNHNDMHIKELERLNHELESSNEQFQQKNHELSVELGLVLGQVKDLESVLDQLETQNQSFQVSCNQYQTELENVKLLLQEKSSELSRVQLELVATQKDSLVWSEERQRLLDQIQSQKTQLNQKVDQNPEFFASNYTAPEPILSPNASVIESHLISKLQTEVLQLKWDNNLLKNLLQDEKHQLDKLKMDYKYENVGGMVTGISSKERPSNSIIERIETLEHNVMELKGMDQDIVKKIKTGTFTVQDLETVLRNRSIAQLKVQDQAKRIKYQYNKEIKKLSLRFENLVHEKKVFEVEQKTREQKKILGYQKKIQELTVLLNRLK